MCVLGRLTPRRIRKRLATFKKADIPQVSCDINEDVLAYVLGERIHEHNLLWGDKYYNAIAGNCDLCEDQGLRLDDSYQTRSVSP